MFEKTLCCPYAPYSPLLVVSRLAMLLKHTRSGQMQESERDGKCSHSSTLWRSTDNLWHSYFGIHAGGLWTTIKDKLDNICEFDICEYEKQCFSIIHVASPEFLCSDVLSQLRTDTFPNSSVIGHARPRSSHFLYSCLTKI